MTERLHGRTALPPVHRPARVPARYRLAAMAYAVAAIGLGCHSYYPTSGTAGLRGDNVMIDVQFATRSAVTIVRPDGDSLSQPDLDHLRGRVIMLHADTVTVQVAKLVARNSGDATRAVTPGTTARVVLLPGDTVRVKSYSSGKTTLLVVGIVGVALIVGLIGLGQSLSYGGGGTY